MQDPLMHISKPTIQQERRSRQTVRTLLHQLINLKIYLNAIGMDTRDPYGSTSPESCIPIKISPCVFDIDKFVKCVSSKPEGECVGQICGDYDVYNSGVYHWAFHNCVQYSHKLVGSCGAKCLR